MHAKPSNPSSAAEQGRYVEACHHFSRAYELHPDPGPELEEAVETALDALAAAVASKGWGPYPRSRDEIVLRLPAPAPTLDSETGTWGYVTVEGIRRVPPIYAEAQPFSEGVAWARRPQSENWELLAVTGAVVIGPDKGWQGISSFSDGLAWVSPNGAADWVAIDKVNEVIVGDGYEDVRPFRRGIAAVRTDHGWGAIDRTGKVVVRPTYHEICTPLADGTYLTGFTDEGLAVVAAERGRGVVDRTGRVLVEPVYRAVLVHPVAFLVLTGHHRWGALDRAGSPVVEPRHANTAGVLNELRSMLANARPVL